MKMFYKPVVLVILLNLVIDSLGLYEDQVGKFDWKLSYVGQVVHASIDLEPRDPRVYVVTKNNVVAALSLKDGNIIWRQVLESGERGVIHFLHAGNDLVTLSGVDNVVVRGWNKSSGLQTFEWVLNSGVRSDRVWTVDDSKLYQIQGSGDNLELSSFHLKSGKAGSVQLINSRLKLELKRCAIASGVISCIDKDAKSVFTRNLTASSFNTKDVELGLQGVPVARIEPLSSLGFLVVFEGGTVKAVVYDSQTESFVVRNVDKSTSSVSIGSAGRLSYLITVSRVQGTHEITRNPLGYSKEFKYQDGKGLAKPKYSFSKCLPATEGTSEATCYTLVSNEDHSLVLWAKDRIRWMREEALANIISVEMVDLPVSDTEAAIEKELANKEAAMDFGFTSGILGMLVRRLNSQIMQLHSGASHILGLMDSSLSRGSVKVLVKDSFGLHKLILVVTEASKIFAIDNDDGEIIWQEHIEGVTHFDVHGIKSSPLYIQRTARHLPLPSIGTIVFKNKNDGSSVLHVFNPITGQNLEGGLVQLNRRIVQCLLLPQEDNDFIHGLLLLDDSGHVDVFPESALPVAKRLVDTTYMYSVNASTDLATGYGFYLDSKSQNLKSSVVWTAQMPDKVVAVVGKRRGERVHSQGRVLSDRSVLYKYINPNLVAIACYSVDPVHKSIVSVYLIDAVSGAIVFSTVHKKASEPIHLVHSENWVVYSFFNEKSRRTEIVTLDLYEGKTQRNTTAFSSLDPPLDPIIERQAFIFPQSIATMKETITEKGITSKHVLVGVSTGSAMELPWILLDPRRAVTPTPEMREEGIVPYIPEINLPPETIITYNHTLPGIAGIHTSPAGLESTCLVFIYGLDLFYTRVAPSKAFDVLKDDFEYWLITAVLTGLISAAYITKKLSSRKALKLAWK